MAGLVYPSLPVQPLCVCVCVYVLCVRCCVFGCVCEEQRETGRRKDKKERGGGIEQLRARQPADDHAMLLLPRVAVMLLGGSLVTLEKNR